MDESYDVFSEESWRSFDEPDSGEHLRFLEAVERGDAETAENFLKPGNIDVNRCVSRGYIHFSALHLAALQDDYKMVQILQHYGAKPLARIPIPKSIGEGILQSRIRIALCRAHASPAYILFYSDDPIRTIFNLCCELKEVLDSKGIRNTCRETFEHLIGKCRNLSCKMLDYCFTSNEVDTLLRGKILTTEDDTCCCRHRKEKIIYRTVEMAIHAEQKEFISHNYCQTLLQREWLHGQPSWSKKASKLPIVYYLIESAIAALMGTVFGNTLGTSALAIDLNINTTSIDEVKSSSAFFSRMGFLLYSAFCLLCVIVLVNLLLQLCQIHMPDCRKQWISNGNSKERRCGCITSEHQHLHRH
ncbi:transient-receptor-potential-like protein isoform X2 [Ptychodera flava]|uniref:transient-receptor-potential-like protein isoform X2 n=1 Tax=Ptychodera flava TaxID=63121 RepID=UPI00396A508E